HDERLCVNCFVAIRGYEKLRKAKTEFFSRVMDRVAALPAPMAAQFSKKQLNLLVSVCHVFHQHAGKGRACCLDCRPAAALIGVAWQTAWRWLQLLSRRKVLKPARWALEGLANEYRYLGD